MTELSRIYKAEIDLAGNATLEFTREGESATAAITVNLENLTGITEWLNSIHRQMKELQRR